MNVRINFISSARRQSAQIFRCIATLLLAVFASMALQAAAQDVYPNRPVKLFVAFPPGGATDVIGREVAKRLSDIWGQPVVVENKPGAGGLLATDAMAKSTPDGYTLLLATDGAVVAIPFLNDKMPYDTLTDLKPIALVGGIPLILVANPSLKVKNLAELIAAAKAKPGAIDYASSGIGASHHLSMENLQRVAGIKLNHISYKGGAPALQDVLGGHVSVMWVAVSTALPHIQSGKLVPIALGSLERSPLLPTIPTVSELGYPGFEAGNWVGVVGQAKMPESVAKKIEADLKKVTLTPSYQERLVSIGNEARTSTSDEFAKRVITEYGRNKGLLSKSNIARE